MAWNLWKVVGGSKLLLLPFSGLVLGASAFSYGTYRVSRSWTGASLGVDFNEAGSICQAVSTVAGLGATGGFLLARHSNYRPLPFSEILLRMERELHSANKTVTKSVGKDGIIISTATSQLVKPPPQHQTTAGWVHAMRFRTRLFLRAARVPARFYFINVFCGAAILGAVTSLAQRAVCGRTGTDSEVGKSFAATVAAKRKAKTQPTQAQTQPQQETAVAVVAPVVLVADVTPTQEEQQQQPPPAVVVSTRPAAPLKPFDSPRDQTEELDDLTKK